MIVFNELIPHVVELMVDPFGNYLMQKLLDVCNEEQRTQIILMVTSEPGQRIRISLNAFGDLNRNHVIQRCLQCLGTQDNEELTSVPRLDLLIQDPYANFVIQAALAVTKGSLHATLVEVIKPYAILRNNPYCKRIISRVLLKN
ncbi:unnamed protein product [Microthlaspi erraticum]|uniref:PUM-HD domain-containing protein n=1 Tax=Microthlaspi erraticum TaxID=1685480 RepID=A0A6D2JV07_9BRAS|nr:unnamed protein product [Microthlaspi erraticum]